MAVLAAVLTRSTLGDIDNAHLTGDRADFDWVNQFAPSPLANLLGRGMLATLSNHWPVEANGRSLQAQRFGSFLDDFYFRIHVSPQRLDMGSVASVQTAPVYVWNAWLVPQTLTEISEPEDGLELGGQPGVPLLFAALQERRWDLSVRPDGQPSVDARIEWVFANGDTAGLRITATRIIAWPFVPDWSESVIERLTAATDMLQSESGVTQRRKLRLAPQREFEALTYVEGRERQFLDLALHAWSAKVWALPIWPDIQLLTQSVPAGALSIPCSTAWLDFRDGGLAMLRGADAFTAETVEIETVSLLGLQLKRATQGAWPIGSRLYPVRTAQLMEQPSLSKLADTLVSASVRFQVVEPSDWAAIMPDTLYRGRPVWDARPDESDDLSHSFERLLSVLDNGMALPLMSDSADRGLTLLGQRWVEQGRASRATLRSFIHAMCGRQKTVWVPTHMDDLTLIASVTSLATTLDIPNIGYTRLSNGKPGRRDIRIELHDGSVFMRRITSSIELNVEVERLVLDSALGLEVAPQQVARISWMVLCRFESDTQEIEHLTDSEGVASWATVFREERDDEL